MAVPDAIIELLLVIAAATVGAAVFERLRLPAVVGFLVTGVTVGPGGLGLVPDPERVRTLAEFGVAVLLFEIGLELPLDLLRREWRSVLVAGALQVALTLGGVAVLAVAAGVVAPKAIVIGMLVAMSSTALVMRVLAQRDEVDAPHGRIVLGILLFQDLCIVPFLLSIPILSGEIARAAAPIALAVGESILGLAVLYAIARFALPWILDQVVRLRSPDVFSLLAFLLAMGSAVIAEEIGLSLAVGAFIAGLVLNASPYDRQLFAEVAPLRGVLLGVFFTAVGMLLDPKAALELWDGVLLFLAGVVIFKAAIIFFVVAWVLRRGAGLATQSGLALAQTGEFSFVLAAPAAAAGLLDGPLQQIFVAGSILSLMAAPFLIGIGPGAARRVLGAVDRMGLGPESAIENQDLCDHVVIIGFGLAGQTLARVLRASGIPYCVLESNPRTVLDGRKAGEPMVFGDATRPMVLEGLGVTRARAVTVAISDPEATRRCIPVIRSLAPDIQIVVRARYVRELDDLYQRGASQVVAQEFESTIDIFGQVLRTFGIPQSAIAHFASEMREEGYELMRGPAALPIDPWLAELLEEVTAEWIDVSSEFAGRHTIAELGIRARTGATVLAVKRAGLSNPNPGPEFAVQGGDSLLVFASANALRSLRALLTDARGGGPS